MLFVAVVGVVVVALAAVNVDVDACAVVRVADVAIRVDVSDVFFSLIGIADILDELLTV